MRMAPTCPACLVYLPHDSNELAFSSHHRKNIRCMSTTWRTPPGPREDLTAQASLDQVGHVKQSQAGLNRETYSTYAEAAHSNIISMHTISNQKISADPASFFRSFSFFLCSSLSADFVPSSRSRPNVPSCFLIRVR